MLAHAIVREGMRAIGAGGNPVLVKRGIDLAVGALVQHLRTVARPVVTEADDARVAAIPADDDDRVGHVLAQALLTVGDTGIVSVEESAAAGMSAQLVDGFEYDNGCLSRSMVTDPASLLHRRRTGLERPRGGIAGTSGRQPPLDEVRVRQNGALACALGGVVDERLVAQQQVVFTAVAAMARPALDQLPVLHLTPS